MLQLILNLWPRLKCQGWELAKFHEQLGNCVLEQHIVNLAFQLMDSTQKPPTDSQVNDPKDNSFRMSHNSSTQVYYLLFNRNQIQPVNDINTTSLVSSECLLVIKDYYQTCKNISLL